MIKKFQLIWSLVQKNSPKRILTYNSAGGNNVGDEAIMKGLVDGIRKKLNGVEIVSCCSDYIRVRDRYDTKSFPVGSKYKGLVYFLVALLRTDLLIIGGGGLFQDYGLEWVRERSIDFRLLRIKLAKLFRKKIICLGVGVGPLKTEQGRAAVGRYLNEIDFITVRDKGSRSLLVKLGMDPSKILTTADLACSLAATSKQEKDTSLSLLSGWPKKINVVVSLLPINSILRKKGQEDSKILNEVSIFLNGILEKYDAKVYLIPMDVGQDSKFLSKILDSINKKFREKVKLVSHKIDPDEVIKIYSQADVVLGARLHSLIFSILNNKPFITLYYHPKVREFANEVGMGNFSFNINEIASPLLTEALDSILKDYNKYTQLLAVKKNTLKLRSKYNFEVLSRFI